MRSQGRAQAALPALGPYLLQAHHIRVQSRMRSTIPFIRSSSLYTIDGLTKAALDPLKRWVLYVSTVNSVTGGSSMTVSCTPSGLPPEGNSGDPHSGSDVGTPLAYPASIGTKGDTRSTVKSLPPLATEQQCPRIASVVSRLGVGADVEVPAALSPVHECRLRGREHR